MINNLCKVFMLTIYVDTTMQNITYKTMNYFYLFKQTKCQVMTFLIIILSIIGTVY